MTKYVLTCDFEWAAHGDDDDTALPQDLFSLAEARKIAKKHRAEFPTHRTFRLWKFERELRP